MIGVVTLGGAPATGKSAVTLTLLKQFRGQAVDFRYNTITGTSYTHEKVMVLGSYRSGETFPGTDRLAMNVQPHFNAFLVQLTNEPPFHGWVLYFEGDRLFNGTSLQRCVHLPHRFYVLEVDEVHLAQRHQQRDQQDEKWLRGRATKVANLQRNYKMTVLANVTPTDLLTNASLLLQGIREVQTELNATPEVTNGTKPRVL